jgi:hypothetical protein
MFAGFRGDLRHGIADGLFCFIENDFLLALLGELVSLVIALHDGSSISDHSNVHFPHQDFQCPNKLPTNHRASLNCLFNR